MARAPRLADEVDHQRVPSVLSLAALSIVTMRDRALRASSRRRRRMGQAAHGNPRARAFAPAFSG
jgi:hypothetical protein